MSIDYNDKAVLDSLGTGKTDGVFQLESTGMKNFMKELKPQSLEDIIAGISLYRPGPMDFIPQYIRGKKSSGAVSLMTARSWNLSWNRPMAVSCIRSRLCRSCRSWRAIPWAVADLVRRAMSKKKAAVMQQERQNFVYGNEAEACTRVYFQWYF